MIALAAPLAAGNLLQMAIFTTDVIFVARLGPASLAASTLAVTIVMLIGWSLTGLTSAASALIAAELGHKRHALREVRRTMRMGGWLALVFGVGAMGLCLLAEPLMRATGQDAEVTSAAGQFVRLLMWCIIPVAFANLLRVFVSTLGRAGIGTAITLLALIVNAIGNWALIYGHLGMPRLGLMGSAWASIITNVAMVAAYALVIAADRHFRRYALLGRWWRFDSQRFGQLLRVGLPIAGTIIAEGGLFSSAAFLMGRIGEAELAGHSVALQIAALAFQVPYGVAQAATIRVGLAYGARDAQAIARAGWSAIVLGIGFMSVTAGVIWLFPRAILSIYVDVDDPANLAMIGFALQYLSIAAAFQLFDGAQAVSAGALRGLQDTRVPLAIALGGYWIIGFGLAVALGLWTPLAGVGVWMGLAAGLVVVSALLLWRWNRRECWGLLPAI
ncbi:MAG: MATE family efflux transporter [Sphingopyxis sp.]